MKQTNLQRAKRMFIDWILRILDQGGQVTKLNKSLYIWEHSPLIHYLKPWQGPGRQY